MDLTGDHDEIPRGEGEEEEQNFIILNKPQGVPSTPPLRRVRQKTQRHTGHDSMLREQDPQCVPVPPPPLEELVPPDFLEPEEEPQNEPPAALHDGDRLQDQEIGDNLGEASGSLKREAEEGDHGSPEKKSRINLIEIFHLHLQSLARQRQKKEAKAGDFKGADAARLQKAILEEINSNL